MKLSETIQEALNEQINAELYSAHVYLSMSAYCESINMPGFAHWMRAQHQEEISHAMKLFDFVNDRDGRVTLNAIETPPVDFGSLLGVMEAALAQEQAVTSLINRLYELALENTDYPAQVLLQWFITEQVEEEKSAADIIEQLKLIDDDGTGLLMIDSRLGQR